MTITTESSLTRAKERTADAARATMDAIGALEMVSDHTERDLLTGYSGSTATRRLRAAQREIRKARELLEALGK